MKTKEQALSKGDWIVVKLGSYYHHGLYISDDEVIHYCSSEGFSILRKDMTVQSTDLHTFSLGKKVLTKIVEESPVNSVDVRV
ncbi:MAG TPA: lecithin retinol acyltransferase family protein, partial [Candidatus Cloacimonadota bacterium]|nr:lecithin retinol acyltransferase family protein [Candidatus Cloacimonadota bacterium]